MSVDIRVGDCLDVLRTLPEKSVQMCVTSPPYFGLRDYGHAGQIGLEPTPAEFVAKLVAVFAEVRRVLKDDGTLWLNLGDSYATSPTGSKRAGTGFGAIFDGRDMDGVRTSGHRDKSKLPGLKPKDLIGIPWTVAFALREDGWYLRSDIIWHKPNPMPESVTDRPTKAHEYLFLLSKAPDYYYDAPAIAELAIHGGEAVSGSLTISGPAEKLISQNAHRGKPYATVGLTRNRRTVWTVTTHPFAEAHFATFPPKLIEPCILAGSRLGDTVLDPFGGAGTTGLVADRLGRNALLIELNPEYAAMARKRITDDAPLFADGAA